MTTRPLRIRHAAAGDLEALITLEQGCFGTGLYRQHQFRADQYRYYLRNPQAILLVATRDTDIVGSVLATVGRRSRAHVGRILSVAVTRTARRLGFASALLRNVRRRLERRGCRHVYLEVAVRARPARALFESIGFRAVRRLPDYYGPGVHGIRMRYTF